MTQIRSNKCYGRANEIRRSHKSTKQSNKNLGKNAQTHRHREPPRTFVLLSFCGRDTHPSTHKEKIQGDQRRYCHSTIQRETVLILQKQGSFLIFSAAIAVKRRHFQWSPLGTTIFNLTKSDIHHADHRSYM